MTALDEKIAELRVQKDDLSILLNQLSPDEPYFAEKKAEYTKGIEALDAGIKALMMVKSILESEKNFEENLPVTSVGATNAITFAKEANENRGFKCGVAYIDWLLARSKTLSNLELTCHNIADEKRKVDIAKDVSDQDEELER